MKIEYAVEISGTDKKTINNLAISFYRMCIIEKDKSAQVHKISTEKEYEVEGEK